MRQRSELISQDGIDMNPSLKPAGSVGVESKFSNDLTGFDAMAAELQPRIDKVRRHCEVRGSRGGTITLRIKFHDFEMITRSRSVPAAVSSRGDLEGLAQISLLNSEMRARKPVRLLGFFLSSLLEVDGEEPQLDLPI